MDITTIDHAGLKAVGKEISCQQEDITSHVSQLLPMIMRWGASHGLMPVAGFNISKSYDPATGAATMFPGVAFTALPQLDEAALDLGWQVLEIPAGKALTINVHDSYDGIPAAYAALMAYVNSNAVATKGWARHVYLSPPGQPIHVQVQIDLA